MPFITALWVLEKEKEFLEKHTSGWPAFQDKPYAYLPIMVAAAFQSAAISVTPYYWIIQAAGSAEQYAWLRTASQHKIKGFRAGPGVPKGIHPYGWSTSKRAGRRLLVAKIGARFIPYVGWGLLAYDAYLVGKWVHGKTRWGNPTPGPTP